MKNIDEAQIVKDYQSGKSWKKITDQFHICEKSLHNILIKHNVSRNRIRRIGSKTNELIIHNYQLGLSSIKISKKLNVSVSYVCNLLKANQLTRNASDCQRKYCLNESVFAKINPNSAYWIGFLAADGNLYTRKRRRSFEYTLQIGLANKDKEHLVKLQNFLGSNRPLLKDREVATKLSISSKQIFDDLHKYNLTPNKSFTLTVCEKLKYNRDFWRGMIDGDGCITHRNHCKKTGYWDRTKGLNLTGSKFVCESFITLLKTKFNYSPALVKSKNVYQVSISKRSILLQVLEFLYKDATTYLNRKYEKAMKFLKEG